MPVILNDNIILEYLPDKNLDGTYNETDIITIELYGEIAPVNKILNRNDPKSQTVNAELIIKYDEEIDKDKVRVLWRNKKFIILDIKESMIIAPGEKKLILKEILE